MAKTKKPQPITETIREMDECDVLVSNYMPYAMSVITNRAIPSIDGFKPAHRKLLYTMFKMGLLYGGRTKSANIAGQGMRLSPHGDAGIYETMVRLTQNNEALLMPFVDGKGNFGKVYSRDMAYAASRYTEAKLMPICAEFLSEIAKDAVDMVDNYDGTMLEPVLLPTAFPNILVSSNLGIAVGMASNFPGFNFGEVCRATAEYIKHPRTNIAEIMPAPDFPTGGEIIYIPSEMEEIYKTGRGSFAVRSVYQINEKERMALVTEIPYSTSVEVIIEKIAELMKAGKLPDISDVRDESDISGLRIAIDFKKGADIKAGMEYLMQQTPLTDSFACNFNLLVDGVPKTLGVREILDEWITFRVASKERVLRFDLASLQEKLHLYEALRKILLDIDKAIEIIKKSETDAAVIQNLMAGFEIDQTQAEFVANIKLRNLNKEYILKQTADLESLQENIKEIEGILAAKNGVKNLVAKELLALDKKYPSVRKAKLVEPPAAVIRKEEPEEAYIEISEDGYVARSEKGIFVDQNSEILVFSDQPVCYKVKALDATKKPTYIGSLAELASGEKVVSYFMLQPESYIACGYENGKVSLYKMADFVTLQNRKMLKKSYSALAPLVAAISIKDLDTPLLLTTANGKKLAVRASELSLQGRGCNGIQIVRLGKNDKLAGFGIATASQAAKYSKK